MTCYMRYIYAASRELTILHSPGVLACHASVTDSGHTCDIFKGQNSRQRFLNLKRKRRSGHVIYVEINVTTKHQISHFDPIE